MGDHCTGTQCGDESRKAFGSSKELSHALDEQELGKKSQRILINTSPHPARISPWSDYEKIVDEAVALMRSDYASVQMLFPERGSGGELRSLAFRGFDPQAARFWEWVRADSKCTCGIALRDKKRVVAPDIANCDFLAGSDHQQVYFQTGIHACQTTPLIGSTGNIVGMISTHCALPINFPKRTFGCSIVWHDGQPTSLNLAREKDNYHRAIAALIDENRLADPESTVISLLIFLATAAS